jgi:type 1 fimbriae regulatory protein FimB
MSAPYKQGGSMSREREKSIKFLTKQELQELLDQAKLQSPREYCMLLLAYRHGLRASEVCRLRLDHLDIKAGNIQCERGKGSVSNWQSLARDEFRAIKLWLKHRPKTEDPHIFISRNGGAMSRSQFFRIFQQLCETAGIPEDKRHPHVLKHSLGTHMANAGLPVQVIQHRLGHRNISSTMVYVQMSNIYVDRAFQAVLDSGGII